MRTLLIAVVCACSGELVEEPPEEPVVEPDPACATDSASPREVDGLPWDLERDLDSDRPVCPDDEPDCDRLAEPDADDEWLDVEDRALAHDDDDAVAYALADPLTSNGKYRSWPNGRIPYRYARDSAGNIYVNSTTRTRLSQAMTNWETLTEGRIKFRPKLSTDTAYVIIKQGAPRVRPFVGYRAGQVQELYLRDSEYITVIKHELGHVVGLHHEQRRSDRLNYIQVRTANIVATDACRYQFSVCSTCKRVGTYDRVSVMHYRTTDLANCRTGPVLLKLDGTAISHYWQLSAKDLNAVATMYASSSTPPTNPTPPVLPETGSLVADKLCVAVVDNVLQATPCTGGGMQDWRITSDGQLRVQESMQCAAVAGCSAPGATVEQRACSATAPDQKWLFSAMQLVNGATGKCLEAAGEGAPIAFKACSDAALQRFDYHAELETIEVAGACVTAPDGALVGGDVTLAPCDGRDAQRWLQARGGFVSRANTGRCMRIEGGAASGTKLELGDCTDMIDQRWGLRGTIRDGRAGLCLQGGADGVPVTLAACDGLPTQTWLFWSR